MQPMHVAETVSLGEMAAHAEVVSFGRECTVGAPREDLASLEATGKVMASDAVVGGGEQEGVEPAEDGIESYSDAGSLNSEEEQELHSISKKSKKRTRLRRRGRVQARHVAEQHLRLSQRLRSC
jgi:hypothetical protein